MRLLLTDSDGVLTDSGVYYGESGEIMKRFSIRDGMGVERLREAGVETAIITGERSGSVRSRAEKLRIPYCYLGIKDKRAQLDLIVRETGVSPAEMGYMGDDVNDLGIIQALNGSGITAAPSDAVPAIAAIVHYRCRNRGGNGAFREFAEWILSVRQSR